MEDCFDIANPDKKELEKIYNNEKRYPWIFKQLSGYEDYCDKYKLHAILKTVSKYKLNSILDNGCGAAVVSRILAKNGYKVTGFDISYAIIKKIPKQRNLKLIVGDSDTLPFPDNSFDCVICSEVLEHIKDNGPSIKEINRVLKKGGIAIITIPNWSCYDCLEGNFGIVTFIVNIINFMLSIFGIKPIYKYGVNMHFHKMFPWQWKNVIESFGFTKIYGQAIYLVPYIPKFRFLERFIYKIPYLFSIKIWLDDLLSPLWPFKYFGLNHLFVFKKSE
ncbi:MAG: class I SAM-dependent methyltransferase [Candidatus Micrarchaeota archaeon]